MADTKKKIQKSKKEKLTVNFSQGSLAILKDLASYYNVPKDQLGRIIFKGLNVLYSAKNAHQDKVFIDKGNTWEIVHIKD